MHRRDTDGRLFPKWSMRDDSPHSWMQAEVRAGAAREAPTVEALSVFRRLPTLPQGV